MKYIKTYESFKVNETMDMMHMPVDPIKNMADVYGEIYDEVKSYLKDKFTEFNEKLEEAVESIIPKIDAEEALQSVSDYFKKDPSEITIEDVKMAFAKMNESWIDKYDAADPYGNTAVGEFKKDSGPVQKIVGIIQAIFGFNILSMGFFGSFITWLAGTAWINPLVSMLGSIAAFIVLHIIRKILLMVSPNL